MKDLSVYSNCCFLSEDSRIEIRTQSVLYNVQFLYIHLSSGMHANNSAIGLIKLNKPHLTPKQLNQQFLILFVVVEKLKKNLQKLRHSHV
jgi:hypothetical protein